MTDKEREQADSARARAFYATHRSARVARWAVVIGLLMMPTGFVVSLSLTHSVALLGYWLMGLGLLVMLVGLRFTALLRS
jgi:hypothetical protein